jgi:RNA polymerase sigma-70 factor (sigma-E family)
MMGSVTSEAGAVTFEELAAAGWPALYRYAYLLAGNHADAEDLAQQTLLKAYRSWSRVTASDSPPAYLRRMLTNTYLSERRPKKRRLELLTDAPPEPGHQQLTGAQVTRAEERLTLWPHVKSLPPRQRAVVVLRYYEDLSEQEIAETLGCSRGNVKSTAHHALKALRAALDTDQHERRD